LVRNGGEGENFLILFFEIGGNFKEIMKNLGGLAILHGSTRSNLVKPQNGLTLFKILLSDL
jgi:hypothetical protein